MINDDLKWELIHKEIKGSLSQEEKDKLDRILHDENTELQRKRPKKDTFAWKKTLELVARYNSSL